MRYDPDFHGETIQKSEIPWEYTHEYGFEEPDVVGCNYEFDIATIRNNRVKYSAFVAIIENNYFDYKEEYDAAREYLEKLIEKQHPQGQNLFDLFQ